MTLLRAQSLAVRRTGRAILSDVSLTAGPGECIAVIGPNGAGKSTLLSALAGLVAPDAGTVSLAGRELRAWPRTQLARRRSYLPQQPVLPVFGGLASSDRGRIERILREHELWELREQPATTLSGGELTRAMLARALVSDPEVLIVDEPVTGLDPRHALECVQRLRRLADTGALVIAALHDLTLALRHATRVVVLNAGRIDADGPPVEVLSPARLRAVFAVETQISDGPGGRYIDFMGPVREVR
jgi:iron complex transport system ATP-binding protein